MPRCSEEKVSYYKTRWVTSNFTGHLDKCLTRKKKILAMKPSAVLLSTWLQDKAPTLTSTETNDNAVVERSFVAGDSKRRRIDVVDQEEKCNISGSSRTSVPSASFSETAPSTSLLVQDLVQGEELGEAT